MVAVILQEPQPRPGRMAYMVDGETRTIRPISRDLMNGQFSGWSHFDIAVGLSNFRTFAIDFGATANLEPIGERRIEDSPRSAGDSLAALIRQSLMNAGNRRS